MARYIKQPRGGYLPIRNFDKQIFDDGKVLHEVKTHPATVGLIVDHIYRLSLPNADPVEVFFNAVRGGYHFGNEKEADIVLNLALDAYDHGALSAEAIRITSRLMRYDTIYRTGMIMDDVSPATDPDHRYPDEKTIENIRILVNRCHAFFDTEGGIRQSGFNLDGSFTERVVNGDGDFLTNDGLWELKVIKKPPNKDHTMQVLMYWRMGLRAKDEKGKPLYEGHFHNIKKLGIFSARENIAYSINTEDITRRTRIITDYGIIRYPIPHYLRKSNEKKVIIRKRNKHRKHS